MGGTTGKPGVFPTEIPDAVGEVAGFFPKEAGQRGILPLHSLRQGNHLDLGLGIALLQGFQKCREIRPAGIQHADVSLRERLGPLEGANRMGACQHGHQGMAAPMTNAQPLLGKQ